jgi:hypothetical protein
MPTLKNNISAVVDVIGVSNVGLVWGLANVNWPSDAERDSFLTALVRDNSGMA